MHTNHSHKHLTYRPEIDGLRAIAVLSVVIYHVGFMISGQPLFSGGYLGVDIFFVISGYLITKIIYREISENSFSISAFYERRARRILPALLFMILVTLPFSWVYLLPTDYKAYFESIFSTIFFYSNIFFWWESGYFDSPTEFKPLIHTWSLAVEEQFYLFFPLLLILFQKKTKSNLITLLSIIFITSLCLAELSSHLYPNANFYLLPTRCWELFAGSILAIRQISRTQISTLPPLVSTIGLGMIIIPMVLFTGQTRHPSLLTLIPVAGTCIIIWGIQTKCLVFRLLSSKLLVGVGLISYSLYLWHQPILAFSRLHKGTSLDFLEKLLIVSICFVAAFISWKFVEQPFRNKHIFGKKLTYCILASLTTISLLFATIGISQNGFPSRFPAEDYMGIIKIVKGKESRKLEQSGKRCFGRLPATACTFESTQTTKRLILIGDSHGGTLAPSLKNLAYKKGWQFTTNNNSSCPYAPGFAPENFPDCGRVLNVQRRDILLTDTYDTIILHSRLQIYVEGDRFDNKEGGKESGPKSPLVSIKNSSLSDNERIGALAESIKKSVLELLNTGKNVVLVYPVPEVGWSVPRSLRAQLPKEFKERVIWLKNKGLHTSHQVFIERTKRTYSLLDAIGDHSNLARIYPEHIFCNTMIKNRCATHGQKAIYYEDDDHLSAVGARLVAKKISNAINAFD